MGTSASQPKNSPFIHLMRFHKDGASKSASAGCITGRHSALAISSSTVHPPKTPSWISKIQPVPSDISGTYSSCTLGTLRSIIFPLWSLWPMPRCHVVNELGKMAHQGQIDRLMRHPGLDQTIGCLRTPPRPFRHRTRRWNDWNDTVKKTMASSWYVIKMTLVFHMVPSGKQT